MTAPKKRTKARAGRPVSTGRGDQGAQLAIRLSHAERAAIDAAAGEPAKAAAWARGVLLTAAQADRATGGPWA